MLRKGVFNGYLPLFLVILLWSVSGCSFFGSSTDDQIVAKAGNNVLLFKDLQSKMSKGLTKSDSLVQANDIIIRWVKKELLLKMAEENLDNNQKDLSAELEEYKNSLLIHRYEQQLLSQKLDTTLSAKDIHTYYENHPEKFVLDFTIVKAIYVEIPRNIAKIEQIKGWMTENSPRSINELENYCFQYASKYDHFNNNWIDFQRILSRIPVVTPAPEQLLKSSKLQQFSDFKNYYFVLINDYILAGEKAPFDFVKDRIESLILNSRKMEYLHDLENTIFEKGKRENQFSIKEFK